MGDLHLSAPVRHYHAWAIPTKHRLELESLTFSGTNGNFHPVLSNATGEAYPPPHWTLQTNYPALYVAGTRMVVVAGFRSVYDPLPVPVRVKGVASNGQYFWVTNRAGPGGLSLCATSLVALAAERVDYCNPLYIHWWYGVPGRTEYVRAGISTNRVYVSWRAPTTANLFHTVVDVACRNAVGQTVESNIVAGIWSDFADRDVRRWDGSGPMRYWGPKALAQELFQTADLVREADGRCGAWQELMCDTLAVHGIPSRPHDITPPRPFIGFTIYASLLGQGGIPMERNFVNHAVCSHGGTLYDPSYGTNYTSKLAWEDASIESFGLPVTPDQKGVLQTEFDPDFP